MAKKNNRSAADIDLTTFAWINAGEDPDKGIPGCGGCHPGGGGMELDRDGRRYDRRAARDPALAETLDGDYFQSRWAETGVIEADCFICHYPEYDYKARLRQLSRLNFQWAVLAGSGIGQISGAVRNGRKPTITYNRRLFNEDGRIVLRMNAEPASENCLFCHARADLLKRGFSWNDRHNHDVHNMHGLECVTCHPADLDHNPAKGDENLSTVRDDLDNTMLGCRQCHAWGYMGAPLPRHRKIRPNHLEKLDCRACHIPRLHRAGARGLCVSRGKVVTYARGEALALGERVSWRPDYRNGGDGLLAPVNNFEANLYTNRGQDGIDHPLFAREIGRAYERVKHLMADAPGPGPLVSTSERIKAMLVGLAQTLPADGRFVRIAPAYHFQGRRWFIDESGALTSETDHTWVAEEKGFNISHNVAPTRSALGANGCGDCHADSAHMFLTRITENSDNHGFPRRTAGLRLASLETYLKGLHRHNDLKRVVCSLAFLLIFLLALMFGRKPGSTSSGGGTAILAGLAAPLGRCVLYLLAFTGYLFFFNNLPLLETIFTDMTTAVRFHVAAGIVFVMCFLHGLSRNGHAGGRRMEIALVLLSLFSGFMICCRQHLGFELRYGLAVIHAGSALVFVALRSASWYRARLRAKTAPERGAR